MVQGEYSKRVLVVAYRICSLTHFKAICSQFIETVCDESSWLDYIHVHVHQWIIIIILYEAAGNQDCTLMVLSVCSYYNDNGATCIWQLYMYSVSRPERLILT